MTIANNSEDAHILINAHEPKNFLHRSLFMDEMESVLNWINENGLADFVVGLTNVGTSQEKTTGVFVTFRLPLGWKMFNNYPLEASGAPFPRRWKDRVIEIVEGGG